MAYKQEHTNESTPEDLDREQQLGDLVTGYMDRLNEGQQIDLDEIMLAHPEVAEELLDQLRLFVNLDSQISQARQPLGTLGDYTLRRQIGRGGMGVVYEAWQGSLDRQVAIKVLPAGIAADNKAFMRFMREAKTAAQLNHQNVVGVYGMGVEQNTPYYSMEYVEGETLAQVVGKLKDAEDDAETPFGKKSEQQFYLNLSKAFADVADGLQHAHSKGVIHRDIKPSNLILDGGRDQSGSGHGRLRILDFGLARWEGQESLTISGDFVGTLLYMSPEQARRKKIPVDYRTDIYSLGATMYQALAGRPPFQGKDHHDTLSQIIERDPRPPRQYVQRIPGDLETIVLKCLRKDPGDRYGTAEALGQDLRRFVRGDPIEARPPRTWELLLSRVQRNRSRLLACGVLLLLIWILGWFAWSGYRQKKDYMRLVHDVEVTEAARDLYQGQLLLAGSNIDYLSPTLFPFRGVKFKKGRAGVEGDLRRLSEIAAAVPERPEACFYLALLYRVLGEDDAALQECLRALERAPDFVPAEVLHAEILNGMLAVPDERFDLMLSRFEGGVETWQEPWLLAYRFTRGADKNWPAAAEAYDRLIAYRERRGEPFIGCAIEALMGRGLASLRMGNYHRAIRDFAGARGLWPRLPEAGLGLGAAYYLNGDKEEAERVFGDLHAVSAFEEGGKEIDHRDDVATWIYGTYDNLEDREQREEWKDRIGTTWKRLRLDAWSLYHQGRLEECVELLERILAESPDDLWSRMEFAWARIGMQWGRSGPRWVRERRDLLADARGLVETYPNEAHAHAILATALQLNGLDDEARTMAETTIAVELRHGVRPFIGTRTYSWVLQMQGEFKRALEVVDTAESRYELKNRLQRAEILEAAERYKDALAEYEGLLRPGTPSALLAARLARVLNRLKRHDEAAERAREALAIDPANATAHEELALALLNLNEFDGALEVSTKAIQDFPDRVRSYFIRGQIFVRLGRIDEAAGSYCDALRLEPSDLDTHTALVDLLRTHEEVAAPPDFEATRAAIEGQLASGRSQSQLLETLSVMREHWEQRS